MNVAIARTANSSRPGETEQVHRGSGDFLADSGVSDPEEFRLKAHLCNEIATIIEGRGITQAQAARVLGLAQPDVSRIVNGRFDEYSVWRLMKALTSLGSDIVVAIHPPCDEPGTVMAQSLNPDPEESVEPAMAP
jgi:predicted XRE-type DNA-binding protein